MSTKTNIQKAFSSPRVISTIGTVIGVVIANVVLSAIKPKVVDVIVLTEAEVTDIEEDTSHED